MELTFKARNMEITPDLKAYAEKRMLRFDRIIGAEEALISMQSVKDRQRLEVTIPYNGIVIRGEEEGYDMYTCIDNVVDKLESQMHKYRNRLIKRRRNAVGRDVEPIAAAEFPSFQEDEMPVKTKTFSMKPMPIEEAIMQLNLLGHDFFAFVNSENGNVNLIYRRKDGDYGLLIPEE